MSKRQINILISPPLFLNLFREESEISRGHACSHCHGNGWTTKEGDHGETVHETCPICEGTGQPDAVITIRWESSKRRNGR